MAQSTETEVLPKTPADERVHTETHSAGLRLLLAPPTTFGSDRARECFWSSRS